MNFTPLKFMIIVGQSTNVAKAKNNKELGGNEKKTSTDTNQTTVARHLPSNFCVTSLNCAG